MQDVNLREAVLLGAYLDEANLNGSDLSRTIASSAFLIKANLRGANLQEADLCLAILDGANLSDAHCSKAALIKAILDGANLSKADFTDADISEARFGKSFTNDTEALSTRTRKRTVRFSQCSFAGAFFTSRPTYPLATEDFERLRKSLSWRRLFIKASTDALSPFQFFGRKPNAHYCFVNQLTFAWQRHHPCWNS